MSLGKRIKELRDKKGWSQDTLGERVGMNRANVSNYERDRNKDIPSETLKKFADVFGVTTDYLLGKSESSESPETEFMTRLELSDPNSMEDFTLFLDGKQLTREEARTIIAFLRTNRQMKDE